MTSVDTARDDDLPALAGILAASFERSASVQLRRLRRLPPASLRVLREDTSPVAMIRVSGRECSFGGGFVRAACLGSLCVDPARRGRGLGAQLFQAVLAELDALSTPISILHPTGRALYERAGFAVAGQRWLMRVDPRALGLEDRELRVRAARAQDAPAILHVQSRHARDRAGHLRPDANQLTALQSGARRTFVVESPHGIDGFTIFSQRPVEGRGRLQVHALAALSPAAARRLWTLFADHAGTVRELQIHLAPHDPLVALLPENAGRFEALGPWMLRVAHVGSAFAARSASRALTGRAEIEVEDPAARERWSIDVKQGRVHADPGGAGAVRIARTDLARLFAGQPFTAAGDVSVLEALCAGPAAVLPELL